MRSGRLLALLLLALMLPGIALAAPRPISLAEYRGMLAEGVARLERADQLIKAGKGAEAAGELDRARALLAGQWRVDGPTGPVDADLGGLEELLLQAGPDRHADVANLARALALAREHLSAAEALEQADLVEAPGARRSLDRALEQMEARSFIQRINDWINRLIGRRISQVADQVDVPVYVYMIGGGIALAALIWLGFSLYRTLSGHGAPGEAILRHGREYRPERPPTPAELRGLAHELSRRGQQLEALRLAHLSLLQHCDQIKLIRYVPAQTNREHEWQLRRNHPNLARSLRTLNDLVDDRLYSGHGATVEDFLRVDGLVDQLWREGDAASKGAEATTGPSLSASSP